MSNFLKNKKIWIVSFVFMALIYACGNEKQTSLSDKQLSQGFQLLEANCFTCHSPDADMENRVAPPMIAIKKHYIDNHSSLEKFTSDLATFIDQPSEDISKMPGAVEKFGLMPKMNFPDSDIVAIAQYIYHTELEAPGWFKKHFQEERKKHMRKGKGEEMSYLERGQQYAMRAKGVLGKNLLSAINSKGSDGAVEFCNEKAFKLTDSMSMELNVKIKRVSDQPRNPNNVANKNELAYIQKFKENLTIGKQTEPEVQEVNEKMIAYYPITTNKMCLQCHGQPKSEIVTKTLEKIDHLYPNDTARNYDIDELRGIWVVEMDKQ